jgi:hypothetical protein
MGTSYILKHEKSVQNFHRTPEETRRLWRLGCDRRKLTCLLKKTECANMGLGEYRVQLVVVMNTALKHGLL